MTEQNFSEVVNDTASRAKYDAIAMNALLGKLAQAAQTLAMISNAQQDPEIKKHVAILSGAVLNAYELLKPAEASDGN